RFDPLRIKASYANIPSLELLRQDADELHDVIHHGENHEDVEQLGQVIQDRDSNKADGSKNVLQQLPAVNAGPRKESELDAKKDQGKQEDDNGAKQAHQPRQDGA